MGGMATGTGFGALIPVAMTLIGVVTMLRARTRRRSGEAPRDEAFERRIAATQEAERRMAAYLAQRDLGERVVPPPENRETGP
jgi:hypothetical protein